MTLLNVRQEQLQALKHIPKQDYEIDLIDDNRQVLIEQERVASNVVTWKENDESLLCFSLQDSPRKLPNNDSITSPVKSSWALAKDDLDKTEPDTIMPHLSEILAWRFVFPKKILLLVERIPIESVDKENELLRGKSRYSKLLSSYPPQIEVDDTCLFCSLNSMCLFRTIVSNIVHRLNPFNRTLPSNFKWNA